MRKLCLLVGRWWQYPVSEFITSSADNLEFRLHWQCGEIEISMSVHGIENQHFIAPYDLNYLLNDVPGIQMCPEIDTLYLHEEIMCASGTVISMFTH